MEGEQQEENEGRPGVEVQSPGPGGWARELGRAATDTSWQENWGPGGSWPRARGSVAPQSCAVSLGPSWLTLGSSLTWGRAGEDDGVYAAGAAA